MVVGAGVSGDAGVGGGAAYVAIVFVIMVGSWTSSRLSQGQSRYA